jgi:hypothetical protein
MRRGFLTIAIALFGPSFATAEDSEKLPEPALKYVLELSPRDIQILRVRKEFRGEKYCYIVTLQDKGARQDWLVRLDGTGMARLQEPPSLVEFYCVTLVVLVVATLIGLIARGAILLFSRSRIIGWLAAWFSIAIPMVFLAGTITMAPREKDWPILCAGIALLSTATACVVEVLWLGASALRGNP